MNCSERAARAEDTLARVKAWAEDWPQRVREDSVFSHEPREDVREIINTIYRHQASEVFTELTI